MFVQQIYECRCCSITTKLITDYQLSRPFAKRRLDNSRKKRHVLMEHEAMPRFVCILQRNQITEINRLDKYLKSIEFMFIIFQINIESK